MENAKRERESSPDEIETAHPGYLISQDTFYVGYLKGVGRIYHQTVVDTYSSVAFAKVYTAKVGIRAPGSGRTDSGLRRHKELLTQH